MGVDSHAGVDALFELQVDQGFGLSLRGVPTADLQSANVTTRSERAEIIRLEKVM